MADWSKLTSRGNVEDRRGFGPTAIGGGIGIVGLVAYLLFSFLGGGQVDMNEVLNQLQNVQVGQTDEYQGADFAGADAYETFASTVVGSSDEMWRKMFAAAGATYTPPTLALFRGSTTSSCGGASAAVGPHYCPNDQTIYLDETFFEELTTRLGAHGGDVAEAYVIAHEAGHHAQNELGIMDSVDMTTQAGSIKLELQADCFAGLWAYSIKDLGVFEPGEIEEAIDAARAVGDDRIQEETTGRVNPEQWTHGSSAERVAAFKQGLSGGTLASCSF
jgi:predicted metalloprotease